MPKQSYSIELDINAENSISDSFNFYESRQTGLGLRFIKSVEDIFGLISENPLLFPIKDKKYHVAPTKIFPYLILYRLQKNTKTIIILEVFHTAQNPEKLP